jgi:hypothetical protein
MTPLLADVLIEMLVVGLLIYLITIIPWPAPLGWMAVALRVIVIVFAVIWLINLLVGLSGSAPWFGAPYPYRR